LINTYRIIASKPKELISILQILQNEYHNLELSEEEKKEYEKEFLENYGYVPDEVSGSAINTWLFNEDTVNKVLDVLMEKGQKLEGGDLLGKTIVFAKNHNHAVYIETCFNKRYPQYAGKMLRIIDNQVYNAQDMIYRFSDPANREFQIAVSVDMLDTGIDIPEILNLVFFKPVRSKAKFWQMVGRGTRLCENIFGPEMDKECFYIFDVCGNLEFFTANIKETDAGLRGSLSQQIFNVKLNLAFILEEKKVTGEELLLKDQLLDELHQIVVAMNEEDFRVRMKIQFVEKYRSRDQWNALSNLDVTEIEKQLSPIYIDTKSDESARWFDLMMLNLMLAQVQQMPRQNFYKLQVTETTRGLLKKLSIPEVKAKEQLIRFIQEDEYWQQAGLATHNQSRLDLRNLIKYIDPVFKPNLYTNFKDELGNIEEIELMTSYQELGSYKKRVEKFIRDNQHHITIHRIRNNIPITQQEVNELEKLLFSIDEHGNKELLEKVTKGQPLAAFIRSILGLDINAAKEAFGEFLGKGTLSATQIMFINTIIDYLSVNGTIDKSMLFEKPFTDIDYRGISGVFSNEETVKVIRIIDQINTASISR